MSTIMYALISDQGTACEETGICEHCFSPSDKAAIMATAGGDIDIERGFVEVTGNEAVSCTICGEGDNPDTDDGIAKLIADVLREAHDERATSLFSHLNLESRFADALGLDKDERTEFISRCNEQQSYRECTEEHVTHSQAWHNGGLCDGTCD